MSGLRASAGLGVVGRAATRLALCSVSHPTTEKAPRERKSRLTARPLQPVSQLFQALAGAQGSGRKTLGPSGPPRTGSANSGTGLRRRCRGACACGWPREPRASAGSGPPLPTKTPPLCRAAAGAPRGAQTCSGSSLQRGLPVPWEERLLDSGVERPFPALARSLSIRGS